MLTWLHDVHFIHKERTNGYTYFKRCKWKCSSVCLRWKQLVSMLSLSASILSSATPFNMGYAFKRLYVHMCGKSTPLKIPYTP